MKSTKKALGLGVLVWLTPLIEYFADIGLTYVSIPIITTGMVKAVAWRPE